MTDIDRSGRIDKTELYVGVLELYLQLHLYGLNIKTPPRSKVEKLMELADVDGNGLDLDEFKQVIEPLVKQTFGRVGVQVALTISCPIIASYVAYGMRVATVSLMEFGDLSAPPGLLALGANLPSTLDETLITTTLMLLIYPLLAMSDKQVELTTEKKFSKESAPAPAPPPALAPPVAVSAEPATPAPSGAATKEDPNPLQGIAHMFQDIQRAVSTGIPPKPPSKSA